jgi:hypothetical protein
MRHSHPERTRYQMALITSRRSVMWRRLALAGEGSNGSMDAIPDRPDRWVTLDLAFLRTLFGALQLWPHGNLPCDPTTSRHQLALPLLRSQTGTHI